MQKIQIQFAWLWMPSSSPFAPSNSGKTLLALIKEELKVLRNRKEMVWYVRWLPLCSEKMFIWFISSSSTASWVDKHGSKKHQFWWVGFFVFFYVLFNCFLGVKQWPINRKWAAVSCIYSHLNETPGMPWTKMHQTVNWFLKENYDAFNKPLILLSVVRVVACLPPKWLFPDATP